MDSVRINGLYTNISPFHFFTTAIGLIGLPVAIFLPSTYRDNTLDSIQVDSILQTRGFLTWDEIDTAYVRSQANGLILGIYESGRYFEVNGVQLSLLEHEMEKLNGLGVAPLCSYYKEFNGVMVSGLFNDSEKGRGVQVGLINRCYQYKGVQFGLWNVIKGRGFPLINMRFKE